MTDLLSELERRTAPVGLRRSERAPADGAVLFSGRHAHVLLWRTLDPEPEALTAAWRNAERALRMRLEADVARGDFTDGYVLLPISSPPTGALVALVRHIESNTQVCRKYVLSPSPEVGWGPALDRVAALALPPPPEHPEPVEHLGASGAGRRAEAFLHERGVDAALAEVDRWIREGGDAD